MLHEVLTVPFKVLQSDTQRKLVIIFAKKFHHIWHKVFKSGPSKTCGGQPLENLKGYGLLKQSSLAGF